MRIDSNFEGGRIEVLGVEEPRKGSEPVLARLSIPPDVNAPQFRQWFYFTVNEAAVGRPLRLRFENIADCTWGDAFGGYYRVHAAYEADSWFRLPTRLEADALTIDVTPRRPSLEVAYHPPYGSARLLGLLSRVQRVPGLAVAEIGRTESGHSLDLVMTPEAPASAPACWIIAQQHPGEPMAGWFIEGLLESLASEAAASLRRRARFLVVPRMNPDGWAVGNHRTNVAGVDLNRQWERPDPRASAVRIVRTAMRDTGVDFFLDAHGEERLPYVFLQTADDYPGRPARFAELEGRFFSAMLRHAPDFQTKHNYTHRRPQCPFLAVAATWVQHTFGCLAATLEMPFSDNALAPRAEGWSPARSKRLGAQTLAAIETILDDLSS